MPIGYYGYGLFIFILVCLLMVLYNYLFSDIKRQKKMLDEKESKLLRLYQSVEDALEDFHESVEKSHTDIERKLKDLGELHAEVERSMRGLAAHAPARIERHESTMANRPAPVPPSQQRAAAQYAQAAPSAMQQRSVAAAPVAAQPASQQRFAQPAQQPSATLQPSAIPVVQAEVHQPQAMPDTMSPPPSFRHVLMEAASQVEPPVAQTPDRNEMIIAMSNEGKTRSQIARDLGITLSEVDLVIGMSK